MKRTASTIWIPIFLVLGNGCDFSSPSGGGAAGNSGAAGATVSSVESKAYANYAVGRITFEDGSPITGDIQDYQIAIYGVSEAGEKVSYSPAVTNGKYKQKLVAGQYAFSPSQVKVGFGKSVFHLKLVPVGSNWNKNLDAADGIVQDFVWKPVGEAETYGATPDPNNATHWHGMSQGMAFATYREDKKASAIGPPAGSKLVFTLTPTSKGINGLELQPISFERDWKPESVVRNDDLNDFMPANYEITGVCKLPDGSSKPLVFQGSGDYPNFVAKGKVTLEVDGLIGGMWKQLMSWGID